MSNFNKIITNKPVTLTNDEVQNLSKTLSAVRTAGGGGGEGKTYIPGDNYININNTENTISLSTTAKDLLERTIPTKVSDLTDYADYQTVDNMSAYLTTAQYNSDSANFATKTELENYQTKGDYLSANALNSLSGTWEDVTAKLDKDEFAAVSSIFLTDTDLEGYATETYVQTASAGITGWVNEQGYLTKPSGDSYYTPLPAGLSDDQYYAMTNSGWKVIQGGGGQGGISTVAHDGSLSGNGNSEDLGIKTDAALNLTNVSAKSAVSAVYANIAKGDHTDYNLGSTLDTISTEITTIDTSLMSMTGYNGIERQIDETTDYVSAFGLTNTAYAAIQYVTANSGDWDNVSAKLDTTAAAQTYLDKTTYATDSATFVTSSSNTITGTKQYALTTAGWAEVSTPTIPDITANNGLSANGYTIGIDNTNLVADTQYAWTTTGWDEVSTPTIPAITAESGISADGYKIGLTTTAINAITSVSSKVDKPDTTQAALNDKYLIYSTLSGEGQPTGWVDMQAKVYSKTEADGTFVATANIDTTTLSGDGKSVSTKLGVKTDVIATKDYVNSSFLPLSGGTVSGSTYFSAASGQNLIAVASAASLIGASRQTSANFGQNNDAMGTTWMGVGGPGMYRGFLKYTQGGNVGALDSNNTMQVEFTPNDKGTIFAKAKNGGNDCPETQILNPTKASCDNMSTSGIDANNMSGPNYMIAKNADGQFVIGAAVFNCQGSLPGTLQPNTYYFVY